MPNPVRAPWDPGQVLGLVRGFQPACVVMAAAELGVFDALGAGPQAVADLAERLGCDRRGLTVLVDALAALGLLTKAAGRYALAAGVGPALSETGEQSVLAMTRHLANCLRSWAQLAAVVQSGRPAEHAPSIRGADADLESFIGAMRDLARLGAPRLVARLRPLAFTHLLDVGGGPGTWTAAFLRAAPGARATLFDLPAVIPIARRNLQAAGLADRVAFVAGDLDDDGPLPAHADLAWVSAIVHMNSRAQNVRLFRQVAAALVPGGRILIRDVVMDDSRTAPPDGALFAVNMLVNTEAGGTFTMAELREDLAAAGFGEPVFLHRTEGMDTVIQAARPPA